MDKRGFAGEAVEIFWSIGILVIILLLFFSCAEYKIRSYETKTHDVIDQIAYKEYFREFFREEGNFEALNKKDIETLKTNFDVYVENTKLIKFGEYWKIVFEGTDIHTISNTKKICKNSIPLTQQKLPTEDAQGVVIAKLFYLDDCVEHYDGGLGTEQ